MLRKQQAKRCEVTELWQWQSRSSMCKTRNRSILCALWFISKKKHPARDQARKSKTYVAYALIRSFRWRQHKASIASRKLRHTLRRRQMSKHRDAESNLASRNTMQDTYKILSIQDLNSFNTISLAMILNSLKRCWENSKQKDVK